MKIQLNNSLFTDTSFIGLRDNSFLTDQRIAGKIAADTISLLLDLVKNKTAKSLLELNNIAEEYIISQHAIPTFKDYKGFPAAVCISVNKELVHGIPTDYHLQEGDIVSFDLGATYNGTIADTAVTCIYGEPKHSSHQQLINATEQALLQSIKKIEVGKNIGIIGHTINQIAKQNNYSVVTKYGGHGVWQKNHPHCSPFISNKAEINEGVRIQEGLTIAIEPLFVLGSSNRTTLSSDGWTVLTDNFSSHHEHTIFVHSDHVEIITERS